MEQAVVVPARTVRRGFYLLQITMDLPNLFTANSDSASRLLLCIVLSDSSIQALLLSASLQGTRIVKKSSVLPYTDQANCIIKTDESLQELGKESEKVNEVLFGLEQAWLKDNVITEPKKALLHALTTELSLKPLGFVIQSEALFQHHLSHNSHISTILLVFSELFLTVIIVAQGQLKLTETVGRSQDVVSDIKEALARYTKQFEGTYLPGKMVCASFVLSEPELQQYQQTLLDVEWGDEFSFVQKPTIDVMRPELAISLVAQQAGQAVAASLVQTSEESNLLPTEETAESLGFEPVKTDSLSKETAVEATATPLPTSFGIPIKSELIHRDASLENVDQKSSADDDDAEEDESPSMWKKILGKNPPVVGVGGKKHYNVKKFVIGGVAAGIVVLVAVSAIFVLFFSQVTAVIVPKATSVFKEVTLQLDPEAQASDPENLLIPASQVTKDLTKEHTIQTTGVKIVGDKAKGEVLLYNKTDSDKNFAKGTVVELGDLQFVTDEDVTVPAAKSEEQGNTQTKTFGEKNTSVTAYLIGVEGNIEQEKEMAVADFDKGTYSAKSTVAFSGGSSREIRVVAEADLKTALDGAKAAILDQANIEFAQESKDGIAILPTQTIEVKDATYSAEAEKESQDLIVTVIATVTALSYKTDDLKPLALAILASEVPDGYEIDSSDPEILSSPADTIEETGTTSLKANISSTALPKLNPDVLKEEIKGKPVAEATSILQSRPGVKQVSLVFYPSWAGSFISSVPSQLERISITVITE